MNSKTKQNLLHDITAVFDTGIFRINSGEGWVDVELVPGYEITMLDFPHLLTIAENYNVTVNIYPIESSKLGVFFKVMEFFKIKYQKV